MQMLSTRGAAAVSPSMAILRGLAPDGGLYVPAEFPSFTAEEIRSLAKWAIRSARPSCWAASCRTSRPRS